MPAFGEVSGVGQIFEPATGQAIDMVLTSGGIGGITYMATTATEVFVLSHPTAKIRTVVIYNNS
jgi:hypothetical protein